MIEGRVYGQELDPPDHSVQTQNSSASIWIFLLCVFLFVCFTHFCTVGRSGDVSYVFIYDKGPLFLPF